MATSDIVKKFLSIVETIVVIISLIIMYMIINTLLLRTIEYVVLNKFIFYMNLVGSIASGASICAVFCIKIIYKDSVYNSNFINSVLGANDKRIILNTTLTAIETFLTILVIGTLDNMLSLNNILQFAIYFSLSFIFDRLRRKIINSFAPIVSS